MRTKHLVRGLIVSALLFLPGPLLAAIQLTPVVSGLSNPLFVGNARDGSNRLFIVQQGGIIKVLQPGSSTPTVFLDIHTKMVTSGEQGLLGLAFHPQYALPGNGRFFVYYTRVGDGTLVLAEYRVSSDPNVASPTETVLLTIPHPTNTNHNGGMLAFGADGYLYIGVGDGGSANDPPNNAQNINQLLGKILRIDVDHPDKATGTSYSSPPDNPFFGATPGRDEIFAVGMRNPWRFSFDRLTNQQWVGDVGQGDREEVDTPIVNGGNYGWRVYEGFRCTNNDPTLCNPNNYIFPIFEYTHVNGRCSITGGYVYRGSLGTLPSGTYVYGDYCTGEIFTWNGSAQILVLDSTMNISSFGEDEAGELYVVGLGGTVSRIESASACSYSIAPSSQSAPSAGIKKGVVTVTTADGCGWTATSNATWIHLTSGASGIGGGTVAYSVDANTSASGRVGTMTIAGQTFTVTQSGGTGGCTNSISPMQATFPAAGGTGTVAVTAAMGCDWTAVSNATWITITGGASGSGNGTVAYSVGASTSASGRTGTMTVAGQTFTVTQSGTTATCTYSISPTQQAFTATGGTGTVAVTAGMGCNWTAVSNATWITISSGASGSGKGKMTYSVDANTSGSARTGTMTIATKTFTVTQ